MYTQEQLNELKEAIFFNPRTTEEYTWLLTQLNLINLHYKWQDGQLLNPNRPLGEPIKGIMVVVSSNNIGLINYFDRGKSYLNAYVVEVSDLQKSQFPLNKEFLEILELEATEYYLKSNPDILIPDYVHEAITILKEKEINNIAEAFKFIFEKYQEDDSIAVFTNTQVYLLTKGFEGFEDFSKAFIYGNYVVKKEERVVNHTIVD